MTAEISAVLGQIQSPAGKLRVQAEKVTSDQITANCSGSANQSWTAAGLMNKTRACTWRYFCLCFLCPGEGDLAWLSGCHHPADWPQKHLGGPWKLGFRLSWSLIIPWPCQVEILEEKEPTGESESSGNLSFLYVSRGCCSGEKRLEQDLFCLQLLREGKKRKSTNLITSPEHILHREKRMFELWAAQRWSAWEQRQECSLGNSAISSKLRIRTFPFC